MLKQIHTILVVDDEPSSLLLLERVLRPNHNVITARSGAEALKVLKATEVSLLITDQRMPGISGTELLREGQLLRPGMVSMLLTSNKDSETFIDAIMNSGAIRVINKPWEAANLLSLVETSLQIYENFLDRKGSIERLKQTSHTLDKIVNTPRR
ncbi:MAG TPA: response regulator [Blastocatellia bacterium]|jgi:response regulator RpfG family c-di-GMP phosphodiesterase|nr:response regulator [Blastocatellia bacterium]